MEHVFVYGTLKKGYRNSSLLKDSTFISEAYVEGISLINTPGYPYAVNGAPGSFAIGELYEIDQSTMESLDRLEGYPEHYQRKQINVYDKPRIFSDDKPIGKAWIYYIETDEDQLMHKYGTVAEWRGGEDYYPYYEEDSIKGNEGEKLFVS